MWYKILSLRTLSLAGNGIRNLPTAAFSLLANLETLYFHGNELTGVLGNTWLGLTSLIRLYLNQNQISDIYRYSFATLPKLNYVNLAYNNLTMLGPDAFPLEAPVDSPAVAKPLTLLLHDNPLMCDAHLCWLKVSNVWLVTPKIRFSDSFYSSQTKLREGNVLKDVCLFKRGHMLGMRPASYWTSDLLNYPPIIDIWC